MATKEKEKEVICNIGKGAGVIKASVDVGLGQEGFVSMAIEEKKLFPGVKRTPLAPQSLGKGSTLLEKFLIVETRVSDVSKITNKMSVTVNLTGAETSKKVVTTDEVDKDGDEIRFRTFVLFQE
jgi:hypothetical protein